MGNNMPREDPWAYPSAPLATLTRLAAGLGPKELALPAGGARLGATVRDSPPKLGPPLSPQGDSAHRADFHLSGYRPDALN